MINNKIPGYDYSLDFHVTSYNIFNTKIKILKQVKISKKNIIEIKNSRLEKLIKKDTH